MVRKVLIMLVITVFTCSLVYAANNNVAKSRNFTASQIGEYGSGEKAHYLGGAHLELGVECAECHVTDKVDDSEYAINGACINCHGDLETMGQTSKTDINPHISHLGQVNCTACHASHETSFVYCNYCHSFDLDIAYGQKERPHVSTLDLAAYTKASPNRAELTDVVVVGSGTSAMVAALSAYNAGVNVIIIEKMPISGGNSQLAAGGMNAAWTRYQKASGIKDSPEIMYEDTMKGGKNMSRPALAHILAFNSNDSMEWLRKYDIILSHVNMGGGAANPRFHAPAGGSAVGSYMVNSFKTIVANTGIDVRLNSRVVKMIVENGAVVGVVVEGKNTGTYEILAKSVVLAAGGFSANEPMVLEYRPEYEGMTTSNQPGALGDGMVLAAQAGANLIDMEQIQIHPSVAVGSQILITEAVRGTGAILVNHEGNRFVDELTTRDKASAAILAQTGKTAYMIFDDDTISRLKQINGYFHLHLVKQGNTPAELAKAINVPADNLEKAIKRYNEMVTAKKDSDFDRKNMAQTIDHGKYYAIEIAPGVHYTMGGAEIDTDAQMIGQNGKIPNLYGAGEVTGGVHGANRLGGNSISETVTFGRLAGENAAKNAKNTSYYFK